jgi:DNA-binding transcriptional ArsR family regulator/biotin operon repressor
LDDPEIERLIERTPHVSIEEILASPRFPAARRLYLDRFLGVYGHDPFLVRLLIETGRFLVYHLAVVLDAGQDPARRETWFTVGRLKQQIVASGLGASARQVDHLVARLREVGFLDVVRSDKDRRLRLLKPTEKMLAHDRDWLVAHYAPLTLLCPHNDYGPVMRRDPEFQVLHRRTATAFWPLAMKVLASVPDMMLFFYRAGGHMVLAVLLQSALADPDHPHAAVPYADIGDRFGVSRTHVRQLLVAAQDAGLVKLMARGGHRVEILPRLWASYDRSIAGGMFLHDLVYGVATGRQQAPV